MPAKLLNPNLALDDDILDVVKKELVPLCKRIRTDRNTLRESWLRYYRIWGCTRDVQAYKGRSQTYIPIGRRIIENHVKRIKRDLFPDVPWDVKARRKVFEERVNSLKGLFTYFFEKHTQLRRNATPWIRQLVTLGTSPVKVIWRQEEREVKFLESIVDPDTGELTKGWEAKAEKVLHLIGPTFRPVDLFAFYVFPYTVQDVDDAALAFEDILVDRDRVKLLGKKTILPNGEDKRDGVTYGHVYEHLEKLWEHAHTGDDKDKVNAERRRLADKGFTQILDFKMPKDLKPVDLTECVWMKALEDDGIARKYLVTLGADDVVLRIQRLPFFHGRSHWLAGKFVEVENEFYGRSLCEVFDKLQYTITDTADQGMDGLTWAMNPIAVVDPFGVQDPTSLRMRPGAKWLAAKGSVQFMEPPKESAITGFQMVGQMIGLVRDAADVSPLPGNQPKGRGRSQMTASGAQLMVQEAQVDVREVVENLEDQVMTPFLYMAHTLTEQFLDRKILLQIEGADGAAMIEQQVGVEDIVGDFEFMWLGSLKSMNEQVRAQQLIQGMGLVAKLPPDQLAAQNVEIGWKELLREIFGTGLGIRNPERFIKDKVRQTSIDWRIENELFQVGRGNEVVVSQADNDEEHAKGHQRLLEQELPAPVQALVFKHLQAHVAAHFAKEQLRVMQQEQQAAQQNGLANAAKPQPGLNGGSRLGAPLGPGRLAQTNDVGDLMRRMPRGGA